MKVKYTFFCKEYIECNVCMSLETNINIRYKILDFGGFLCIFPTKLSQSCIHQLSIEIWSWNNTWAHVESPFLSTRWKRTGAVCSSSCSFCGSFPWHLTGSWTSPLQSSTSPSPYSSSPSSLVSLHCIYCYKFMYNSSDSDYEVKVHLLILIS